MLYYWQSRPRPRLLSSILVWHSLLLDSHTCTCRLIQEEAGLAEKAEQASAALPGIQASLERSRAQTMAGTQKAEALRQRRQRLQVRKVSSNILAHVSSYIVISYK